MSLKIIYRGHLSDCNYTCPYCPFSMRRNSKEMQALDRKDLARFVAWAEQNSRAERPLEILITPYGEALTRKWYQEAVISLSRLPHVNKIAVQTNLSCNVQWLARCNEQVTALWVTYHPEQVSEDRFLEKCAALSAMKIRYSVGVVGMRAHFERIAALRARLPTHIYLWVNAYKREGNYYSKDDIDWLTGIDPLFRDNLPYYPSSGKACRAGSEVISIEGNGDVYRCHFIKNKLGNIFEDSVDSLLKKEPCSNANCHCHIGYIHLEHLSLYDVYGTGLLERIPQAYLMKTNP